jgi:polar amino acid transport system substrate-binding protein
MVLLALFAEEVVMRLLVAACLTVCALVFPRPLCADPAPLKLITGDDYPPWTDKSLPHGGLATWLVTRSFAAAEYPLGEILWQPWKRGFEDTKRGESDGAFPWIENAERLKIFEFSAPFLPTVEYAWTRADGKFQPTARNDLFGRVFCRPLGYGEFGLVRELMDIKALRRETPRTMASCFKMLSSGRVDFVYATRSDAENAMREGSVDPAGVRRAALKMSEIDHHLIVAKANPRAKEIVAAFDRGFAKLKASGEWDRMKAEFGWKD